MECIGTKKCWPVSLSTEKDIAFGGKSAYVRQIYDGVAVHAIASMYSSISSRA